jgi:hypothetical protein
MSSHAKRFLAALPAAALALFTASLAPPAAAADPIGYVKTASGEATVTTAAGNASRAQPGTALQVGDVLKTSAGANVGVTLKDNTMMSFGPSTTFTFEEYLFAPARGELKLGGRIGSGSMHYVSGVIAKLKPDAVTLRTPTGMIGIRGTTLAIRV